MIGGPIGDELLRPTRIYVKPVLDLLHNYKVKRVVRGMAHITGGGLIDNPPRIFPAGLAARLHRDSWPVPPIFGLIQRTGQIEDGEMAHVFNLGLGMLLIIPHEQAAAALEQLGEGAWVVGEMVARGTAPAVEIVE